MHFTSKRSSIKTWLAITVAIALTALIANLAGTYAQQRTITELKDRTLIAAELNSSLVRNVLERYRSLPYVLAQNRAVLGALDERRPADILALDASLESLSKGVDASAIYVLDRKGHTIAASNWREPATFVGVNYEFRPYFQDAMRMGQSEHFALGTVSHRPGLYLAHRVVDSSNETVGVVVIKVDLSSLEADWRHQRDAVFVTDENGVVILTSESAWRYRALAPLNAHTANALKTIFQFGSATLQPLTFPTVDDAIGLVGPPSTPSTSPSQDQKLPPSETKPDINQGQIAPPVESPAGNTTDLPAPPAKTTPDVAYDGLAGSPYEPTNNLQAQISTSTSSPSTSPSSTFSLSRGSPSASPFPSEASAINASPLNLLTALPIEKMTGWTLHILTPVSAQLVRARTNAQLSAALASTLLFLIIGVLLRKRERSRRVAKRRQEIVNELEREVAARTRQLENTHHRLTHAMEEKLRTQQRIQALQEDLAQANKLTLLGQVAAGVAHEINQPLSAITSYSENATLLLQREQTEAALKNLASIQNLAQRIGRITSQLRNFSRRARPDSNHSTKVQEAIDGALLLINASDQKKQLSIQLIPAHCDLRAAIDKIRLEQILVNLLQNARDAVQTVPSPLITIEVEDIPQEFENGARVRITVTDNGNGLSDEALAHLFIPFSSSKSEGLGLGLVISRDLAKEANGDLTGTNLDGIGARFTLELPQSPSTTAHIDHLNVSQPVSVSAKSTSQHESSTPGEQTT